MTIPLSPYDRLTGIGTGECRLLYHALYPVSAAGIIKRTYRGGSAMGITSDYEQDLFAWAERNAGLIRQGRYEELDYQHLAEELEEFMGNTRRELYRRLRILLAHLLKWRYQPEARSSGWAGTIRTQRSDLARLLKQNPSLKRFVAEEMDEAYEDARELAATETGKPLEGFPDQCPFPADQVLDKGFWPEGD